MSLGLLWPAGLLALAALSVPLVIHLVRHHVLTRTPFSALRWIPAQAFPQHRVQLERPWLLLLRLALIGALALLLAIPVWRESTTPASSWVVVVPGVSLSDALSVSQGDEVERRWLAPGFPSLSESPPDSSQPIVSLLRELDAQLPPDTKLTVIAPAILSGLDGERPQWQHAIDWHKVSTTLTESSTSQPTAHWAVRYLPETRESLPYLQAAMAIWRVTTPSSYALDSQPVEAGLPATETPLVWLAPPTAALYEWVEQGGTALLAAGGTSPDSSQIAPDSLPVPLPARGSGRLLSLPGRLLPQDWPFLLDDRFPEQLHAALFGPSPAPDRATLETLISPPSGKTLSLAEAATRITRLDTWLIGLIALLFLFERLIANWPRNRRRP